MKVFRRYFSAIGTYSGKHKSQILFFFLFVAFVFLRWYQLADRAILGWDQADSAWAAKSILYDNPFRLEGVPIKGDASMFMGPLYYYLITPFYYFTHLDMIAAPLFAGVMSIFSFLIFYSITKKLFDPVTTFLAAFIYVFCIGIIIPDRIQAAYVLIPILAYVIFYFLYKCIMGEAKYIFYLALAIGFGFHVHFTTTFYVPIVALTLPFFPRTKKTVLFIFLGLFLFLLFVSPMLSSMFFSPHSSSNGVMSYLSASSHGLHARRVLQIAHDAFISFEGILQFRIFRPLAFVVPILFAFLYYIGNPKRERSLFIYLLFLWIVIPWIILSTYSGELTDYYFLLPRNIAIVTVAFLLSQVYKSKSTIVKALVVTLLSGYAIYNVTLFFALPVGNYRGIQASVLNAVKTNIPIAFKNRDPLSYMYYVYVTYR